MPNNFKTMDTTNTKHLILKIIGVVLILFIAYFFRVVMINNTLYNNPIRNDAREYYSYAVNMKFNETYSRQVPKSISDPSFKPAPDKVRPPGYALFLYPWVKFPPDMSMVYKIQYAQVIIDTLTVLLAFGFFRLFLSYGAALFTTLLVAISPHLIAMNIYILTETLFTFTLTLYLYVTTKGLKTSNLILIFLSGLLLAVTILVKPTMNYFIFFIGAMLLFTIPKKNLLKISSVMLLGFIITISPWSIRNMSLASAPSTKAIASLKNGSYPGLMFNNDPRTRSIPHRADPNYYDTKNFKEFLPVLINKITKNPGEYISWYLFGKPAMFFSWDMVAGMGDIYIYPIIHSPYFDHQAFRITHAIMKGFHILIVLSSLLMLILIFMPSFRKRVPDHTIMPLTLCAVMLLYFTLIHVVGNPLPRYSIPLRPIQLLLFTYFFIFLYDLFKKHQQNSDST